MKHKFRIFYQIDGGGSGGTPAAGGTSAAGNNPNTASGAAGAPSSNNNGGSAGSTSVPNIFNNNPPAEPTIPEQYTFNLPAGLEMPKETAAALTEIAKNSKLSQDAVDGLLKLHSEAMLGISQAAEKQKMDWYAACQKEGLDKPENVKFAALALKTFGGEAAMNVLVETGVANNPDVQRMLQTIGRLISEDVPPESKPAAATKNDWDILFPNSKY